MNLKINIEDEFAFLYNQSYLGNIDVWDDKRGFIINEDFLRSDGFDKILIHVLFKNYPIEFEKYLIDNQGFSCSIGEVNEIFGLINDINLIKEIAQEHDGFVNVFEGEFPEIDGDEWEDWYRENIKKSDIIILI